MLEGDFEFSEDDMANARIVIVDDESLVTKSLSNLLFLDLDVEPITFNEPILAREYIQSNTIDVIISDFLMPELDGIELLRSSRESQPVVPRILLTGYADKENAIKAINEVQLFQYVQKPWDNEQLKNVIKNALERQHLVRRLTAFVDRLAETEQSLGKLRKNLIRAFA